ncbi:hypothetical protein WUBG_08419 [Wuchereria bancrofti]|uniref:Uncharacterized protein n=1 Tax=Wuchereria bancrofti TaxID=6293 RepID=J9EU72_WUCBA|nr:hypothetical protein WUBG_08419 [Wuchereria bancrofti]
MFTPRKPSMKDENFRYHYTSGHNYSFILFTSSKRNLLPLEGSLSELEERTLIQKLAFLGFHIKTLPLTSLTSTPLHQSYTSPLLTSNIVPSFFRALVLGDTTIYMTHFMRYSITATAVVEIVFVFDIMKRKSDSSYRMMISEIKMKALTSRTPNRYLELLLSG